MGHTSLHASLSQLPIDPSDRPQYTLEQLQLYFQRIKLPQQYHTSPLLRDPSLARTKEHGLPFLRAMHIHHHGNFPFENLELHYSKHRSISLSMDDLFDKFVTRGIRYGRGGRCMESNGFFGTVMRSLGYDVRNCGGRVSRSWSPLAEIREKMGQTYDNWNHMLNLVRLDGEWWVVDIGMGSMGPMVIFPLQDGFETVSVPPRKIRLQKRTIPEHVSRNESEAQKLWCFDQCLVPDQEGDGSIWIPTYCFTETEFLPQDYEACSLTAGSCFPYAIANSLQMMSYFTSTNKKCFFTYSVLCTRLVLDDAGEKVIGDITLFNDGVRSTIGGKREDLAKLKTEEDRVKALKDIFDIELTIEERENITPEQRLG